MYDAAGTAVPDRAVIARADSTEFFYIEAGSDLPCPVHAWNVDDGDQRPFPSIPEFVRELFQRLDE